MEGNSAIRKMFERGQELAASFGRENVYDFSLGNPMAPVPYEVKMPSSASRRTRNLRMCTAI